MVLTPEDIEAVAAAVVRKMRELEARGADAGYQGPEWARQAIQKREEQRAEELRQVAEIRRESQKMPAELRPVPEQYKSRRRKEQILEMVKDPSRWEEIPKLSKQWPSIPRKKPADKAGGP